LNATIYSMMIKGNDGNQLSYSSSLILSAVFIGIILGLAIILVGGLLAIGFAANR